MHPVGAQRRCRIIVLKPKHRVISVFFQLGAGDIKSATPTRTSLTYNHELWVPLLAREQRKPLQSLERTIT